MFGFGKKKMIMVAVGIVVALSGAAMLVVTCGVGMEAAQIPIWAPATFLAFCLAGGGLAACPLLAYWQDKRGGEGAVDASARAFAARDGGVLEHQIYELLTLYARERPYSFQKEKALHLLEIVGLYLRSGGSLSEVTFQEARSRALGAVRDKRKKPHLQITIGYKYIGGSDRLRVTLTGVGEPKEFLGPWIGGGR